MKVKINTIFGSHRRISLLRILFDARGPLAATELSRLSRVSLPQTGRILREFVGGGAVISSKAYPTDIYTLEPHVCEFLRPIFAQEGLRSDETSLAAIAVMVECGAPLMICYEKTNLSMSHETAFVQAVRMARYDASLLSTLPVVVARFRKEHRRPAFWMRLRDEARRHGVERHTGMLFAVCSTLLRDRHMLTTSRLFQGTDRRPKNLVPFRGWYRSFWERRLAEKTTPPVAREWGFLMNTSESDLSHHLGASQT